MAEQRLLDYLRRKRLDLSPGPEDIRGGMGDLFRTPPAGVINQPNLPSLALQTQRPTGPPQIGGSYSTPFMGGQLGFEGSYQPSASQAHLSPVGEQPNWGSMLRFRQEF